MLYSIHQIKPSSFGVGTGTGTGTGKSTLCTGRAKMQAALSIATPVLPLAPKNFSQKTTSPPKLGGSPSSRRISTKVATSYGTSTVDYSSMISVFPAEACETIGGDACLADIYPEVKLQPEARTGTGRISSESIDREYLEYNEPKTVFRGEACDDLGGEFCSREYQKGVY